jgi:peptidoglycan/xylan/chitin deacetylase (PgdA/CDA1 family)
MRRRSLLFGAAAFGAAASAMSASRRLAPEITAPGKPDSDPGAFWPDSARLVVSVSLQMEAGASGARDGLPIPALQKSRADSVALSWNEYAYAEGVPRLLDLFDKYQIKVTAHVLGEVADAHPALTRELAARGHEVSGHGQTGADVLPLTADQEQAEYSANVRSIQRATGIRPLGMNSAGMHHTPQTLNILQKLGFIYHVDDVSRDEPFVIGVNGRPFVVVPYTLRNNDFLRYADSTMTAAAFRGDLLEEFDCLYREGGRRRRMMCVCAHDRISGTPARVQALDELFRAARARPDVAFMRKDAIARHMLTQTPPAAESGMMRKTFAKILG